MAAEGLIASRGYYSVENGPQLLLNALYDSSQAGSSSSSGGDTQHEYLGDSRRENGVETKADEVAFKGIRMRDWIVGANKTHITPLDDMDKYRTACHTYYSRILDPKLLWGLTQW
jgi:hypothetical protein